MITWRFTRWKQLEKRQLWIFIASGPYFGFDEENATSNYWSKQAMKW